MNENLAVVGLAAVALAACASPGPEAPVRAAGLAIDAAWRAHIDAAVRKDLAGVVAMYADDAVYLVGDEPIVGLPAIEAMEAAGLAGNDLVEATHTILELRRFEDVAYEIGTVVGPVRPHGEERTSEVHFAFMAKWVRGGDGAWRLHRLVGR